MMPRIAIAGLFLLLPAALAVSAQEGKYPGNLDVPYVPTAQLTVEAMLRLAAVGPKDYVIDLGSGDGRILITAAKKYGARGMGVDLDPQRVKESIANANDAGVADRVQFYQRNLFDTKISEATVVTMYLLPKVNLDLRPRLFRELKPGTRIVSHQFDMGDWKPDIRATVRGTGNDIFYWTIPAQVHGIWKLEVSSPKGGAEYEVDISQKYQEINVVARRGKEQVLVISPRLDGDAIEFVIVDKSDMVFRRRFEGRVGAGVMEGIARGDANAPRIESKWRAARAPGG